MGTIRKYIYLRKDMNASGQKPGQMFVNVHYLEGYNSGRILDYHRMSAAMKMDIREIQINQVECNHVTKSSSVQGFTLARWDGVIKFSVTRQKELEKAGWHIVTSGYTEYYWA